MSIRIGIIGAGATVAIADLHAQGFLKDERCRIAAVCSRTRQSCERLCEAQGLRDVLVTTEPEQLYEAVDAVVVCTPNQFHLQYLEEAVRRGKAVLVEKPLGLQFAQPGQERWLLGQGGALVRVGYVYRQAAVVQRLLRLLRERMGRIYFFEAVQGGTRLADPRLPLEWRMQREYSGSGALGDFGSHLLDLARYLGGVRVEEAAGYGGTFIPARPADRQGRTQVENDDAFVFCGRGQGGEVCSFSTTRVGMDGVHLCISGEGGLVRAHLESGRLYYLPKQPGGGYETPDKALEETWFDLPAQRFERQAALFLDAMEGRPADLCTLEEALEIENTLQRIEESAR